MIVERFGSYTFPTAGRGDDEQLNEGRSALQTLPAASGAWDHLGDDGYLGPGGVTHRCALVGSDYEDLDDVVDAFLAAMNAGRQKLYWRMRDGSMRWAWARKVSISMPTDGKTRLVLPVSVTFEVPEATRYGRYLAGPVLYGGDAGLYGAGLIYGQGDTVEFAFSLAAPTFTITNAGNAPALAQITISCGAGQSAENCRLNRKVGGATVQYFQATRIIAASKSLVVDCETYSVEYDGADDYDNFDIGTTQVEWMHLEPGDNSMEVVCANPTDAGTIRFEFYPTYH